MSAPAGLAALVLSAVAVAGCGVSASVSVYFHCKVVINSSGQYLTATVTETSINGNDVKISIVDGTTVQ